MRRFGDITGPYFCQPLKAQHSLNMDSVCDSYGLTFLCWLSEEFYRSRIGGADFNDSVLIIDVRCWFLRYGSCKFYEKEITFSFCPDFVDVGCDPCGSGPTDQSSDFLFEQE